MCLRAYTCICGDSHSIGNQKVGRPLGEGGGCKLPDNPGQTREGGSENLDFGRTSLMNVPLIQLWNMASSRFSSSLKQLSEYFSPPPPCVHWISICWATMTPLILQTFVVINCIGFPRVRVVSIFLNFLEKSGFVWILWRLIYFIWICLDSI